MMCKQDKAVYCFPNACMWDANGIVSWEPQSLPFKFDRKSMLDLFVLPAAISVFKSVFFLPIHSGRRCMASAAINTSS